MSEKEQKDGVTGLGTGENRVIIGGCDITGGDQITQINRVGGTTTVVHIDHVAGSVFHGDSVGGNVVNNIVNVVIERPQPVRREAWQGNDMKLADLVNQLSYTFSASVAEMILAAYPDATIGDLYIEDREDLAQKLGLDEVSIGIIKDGVYYLIKNEIRKPEYEDPLFFYVDKLQYKLRNTPEIFGILTQEANLGIFGLPMMTIIQQKEAYIKTLGLSEEQGKLFIRAVKDLASNR